MTKEAQMPNDRRARVCVSAFRASSFIRYSCFVIRHLFPVCLPFVSAFTAPAVGQDKPHPAAQNPSPMVEHTRSHPRLKPENPEGKREQLEIGTLFLPSTLSQREKTPLFVHFHGGTWIPEVAAARHGNTAVITVQLGSGSSAYAKPFAAPERFGAMLTEAERKSGTKFEPVALTAWSAGYGAVREILKVSENYDRVASVLLIDALHTGYVGGKPGPLESQLETDNLEVFLKFARDAVAGKKQMLITHSEIFPGTFASTTETADYLIRQLGLRRKPVLQWGPMRTQQLSEVSKGCLRIIGYAGNSAPDHVDQLHALPDYLKWLTLQETPRPRE